MTDEELKKELERINKRFEALENATVSMLKFAVATVTYVGLLDMAGHSFLRETNFVLDAASKIIEAAKQKKASGNGDDTPDWLK